MDDVYGFLYRYNVIRNYILHINIYVDIQDVVDFPWVWIYGSRMSKGQGNLRNFITVEGLLRHNVMDNCYVVDVILNWTIQGISEDVCDVGDGKGVLTTLNIDVCSSNNKNF